MPSFDLIKFSVTFCLYFNHYCRLGCVCANITSFCQTSYFTNVAVLFYSLGLDRLTGMIVLSF